MSYSPNSLKAGYIKDYMGTTTGAIKGDTRSLDCSSYEVSGRISLIGGPGTVGHRALLL